MWPRWKLKSLVVVSLLDTDLSRLNSETSLADDDDPEWMIEAARKSIRAKLVQRHADMEAKLAKIRADEDQARKRYESGESSGKRQVCYHDAGSLDWADDHIRKPLPIPKHVQMKTSFSWTIMTLMTKLPRQSPPMATACLPKHVLCSSSWIPPATQTTTSTPRTSQRFSFAQELIPS